MKVMPDNHRHHLRGAARKVDESHAFNNFREKFADANDADMAQRQAAMDQKRENAEKRLKELQDFEPILDLEGETINNARVDTMKKQLRWHRDIGGDDEIPPGFYRFKKVELWNAVTQAVERHREKQMGYKGE